ncbi:hypothetical protein D3C72_1653400 [compost metagenome]
MKLPASGTFSPCRSTLSVDSGEYTSNNTWVVSSTCCRVSPLKRSSAVALIADISLYCGICTFSPSTAVASLGGSIITTSSAPKPSRR